MPDSSAFLLSFADSLLFVEGAALFRTYGHGDEADLREALADADAERTILLNLSEHLQRMTTDALRRVAERDGYELGADLATYNVELNGFSYRSR